MNGGADFARLQADFAGHLRDPRSRPPPAGIEPRRMQVYRELIFNNIAGFIRNGFPVLWGLLGDARGNRLVRDFLVRHRSETPYFLEIGREFLAYLQEEYQPEPEDPDFLLELAHYEWVELALDVADSELPREGIDPHGDLLNGRPVVSPLAWVLSYRYQVHLLGPGFRPAEPPPTATHLVVYRNRADEVNFLEINAVTARLLQLLGSDPESRPTGEGALAAIAVELGQEDAAPVVTAGRQIPARLRELEVLLGTLA